MEALCRRIVRELRGKGIREMPGRIDLPAQHVGGRKASLHAALPRHEHGGDPVVVAEPVRRDHAAHIHDNNDMRKMLRHRVHHGELRICQIEIAVLKELRRELLFALLMLVLRVPLMSGLHRAVPALAGETADRDHRSVRERRRALNEVVRERRLHRHAGDAAHRVLLLYILLIEISELIENADISLDLFHFHAVKERADVRDRHVAAASAALHIVDAALAEEGELRALPDRESLVLIFQKDHALACCLSGELDVLPAPRHALPIPAKREARLKIHALPFSHKSYSSMS